MLSNSNKTSHSVLIKCHYDFLIIFFYLFIFLFFCITAFDIFIIFFYLFIYVFNFVTCNSHKKKPTNVYK